MDAKFRKKITEICRKYEKAEFYFRHSLETCRPRGEIQPSSRTSPPLGLWLIILCRRFLK